MSQAYYIVVNSRDLPCNKAGQSSEGLQMGCFAGAYSYDTEIAALEAAGNFTLKTKESHAVYQIRHRVVYIAKTETTTFNG